MGNYKCQRPIHPGELLKEEVGNRKLPQTKLAAQTGISYKELSTSPHNIYSIAL
jgi:plasmid maintenance system antidote protein VapI